MGQTGEPEIERPIRAWGLQHLGGRRAVRPGPQTLRLYEHRGLLAPTRSAGGTRRYSDDDLQRLHRITELLADGVNIAGIGQILDLQDRNTELESDNTRLKSDNSLLKSNNALHTPAHRRAGPTIADRKPRKGNDHDQR